MFFLQQVFPIDASSIDEGGLHSPSGECITIISGCIVYMCFESNGIGEEKILQKA